MAAATRSTVTGAADAWKTFSRLADEQLAQFERSLAHPAAAQQDALCEVIDLGADSAFGHAHRFSEIASIEQYRERVPVSRWPEYSNWVEQSQVESGGVLTSERPIHFERTSGSTARARDIPYTPALLAQFQRALVVWLAKLYAACPDVAGPAWWSLSPDTSEPACAANGIPIGSASDAAYLQGSAAESLLPSVIDTHSSDTLTQWQLETLAIVAEHEDLALVSVWSPTFLGALLDTVLDEQNRAAALQFLKRRLRAERYRALVCAVDAHDFSNLWPRLRVISAWSDGPSERFAARIAALFPQATLVPKGLFATEGVVSLSWGLTLSNPLAIESHFLEFLDGDGEARLVEEIEPGEIYEPVLTTAGGLYRYALGDLVEVTGYLQRTPCIRFVGRSDLRSDLVGEKLDAPLVAAAFDAIGLAEAAVLVPDTDARTPHYVLLAEIDKHENPDALAYALDEELSNCFHYGVARRNAQLGALRVIRVGNLSTQLHTAWEGLGKRSGDAKSACLVASADLARQMLADCQAERVRA